MRFMKIEKTEIWITCDKPLEGDGRKISGFFVLDLLPTKVLCPIWITSNRKRGK